MKILFASSEVHPLVKTGGLADVSGALPRALKNQHQDVRLILPAYQSVTQQLSGVKTLARIQPPGCTVSVQLHETRLPDSRLRVYLVDIPEYFDRPGNPYLGPDGQDWPDNAQRFHAFARSVVELALDRAGLDWQPDLVHCNDWQTGLVPALLSLEPTRPATVFTIHNLAYQGLFDWETFRDLGLPGHWWSLHALEFHGQLSFIKGGLVFADWITTVSPTYAEEIRTPAFGCGLEGLLQIRADRLRGILNGADYRIWNPNQDPHLPHHYNGRSLAGKAANKAALQREFDLPEQARTPLFAHIGRLVAQKGIDLLLDCLPQVLAGEAQLVLLGSGEPELEARLQALQAGHPDKIGLRLGYDEALAHRIEAGADMFVMPSRFEPCGLNQLYSLRYGTLPVVRRTGGLADTVIDADATARAAGTATGFVFTEATPQALAEALRRALHLYPQTQAWKHLVQTAMRQDFSWKRSAGQYLELYETALAGR
ncbi:MAG: glycogen synthase GlgA [Gammaproteobacteria bacterium]|nr:glycogen synthase GlgA [Gammaproteobacteria bacterium]